MKTKLLIIVSIAVVLGVLISTSGIFTPLESDLAECYYTDDDGPPRPCRIIDGWYDALFYSEPLPLDEQKSVESLCVLYGGNWLDEYRECEDIEEHQCSLMGGKFNECESKCRNLPDYPDVSCVAVCSQVCSLDPQSKLHIEQSVRQEIQDLFADTDVKGYSVNLDSKTGIIEITASDDSYDSQIKEIISKYPSDIEFNITYGPHTIIHDDFDPNIDYLIELKNGNSHGGQYTISNAIVQNVTFYELQPTLIFKLQEAGNGHMQIMIASGLLYPMDLMAKSEYVVLADGIEIEFIQHSPIILEIPFKEGTKEIRIVGGFYPLAGEDYRDLENEK